MSILETVIRNQSPTYNLSLPDLQELLKEVHDLAPIVHIELSIETSISVHSAKGATSPTVMASVRACVASTGHNWDIITEAVLQA
jgi:hypothetical protein